MKVSLKWLNDLVDLADLSTREIDDLLTFAGIEVEGIQSVPQGVVAAIITSSEKHSNADKLSVCQVDDGSGTPKQIVCGAKNYAVNDVVPLAAPGTAFPSGFEIVERKMRGQISQGMLCSAAELGLAEESDGLLILPDTTVPGTPLSQIYPPIFDLEITPNRPDLLSHRGIARELATLTDRPLLIPKTPEIITQIATNAEITVSAPHHAPFYSARHINHVKVGPSPEWLQEKLQAVGLRPINNIVDITNYVLMETGQPLHAFDASKLNGGFMVRIATAHEKFLALDGEEYSLRPEDVVVADANGAIALGGIMGGEISGVTENTTSVILESAYFAPPVIRRTSRDLNLSSDSSYRFERGVDPQGVLPASALATQLIVDLAAGKPADAILTAGTLPILTGSVQLDEDRARSLLGIDIPAAEMHRILAGLGLTLENKSKTKSSWRIPSYRIDLQRHIDLVEEIARVHGLDKIPATTAAAFAPASPDDIAFDRLNQLRSRLSGLGFLETKTIKLLSSEEAVTTCPHTSTDDLVTVKNPLSEDHTTLRPSLIPGLLSAAERNSHQGATTLRFYETGTVFRTPESEKQLITLLAGGDSQPSTWHEARPRQLDISDLRGFLETILPVSSLTLIPSHSPSSPFVLEADITIDKKSLGLIGQIQPAFTRKIDFQAPILIAELNAESLWQLMNRADTFEELDRFPAVSRDVAMELPAVIPNGDIQDFFDTQKESLLVSARLFDVFTDPAGEKLPAHKKSLAYSLTYRDKTKTLTTSEVDDAHGRILAALKQELPVQIR
ncbi:MAG: phenylalanine--tRNA ligase subunit beta [Verrucomicrobiota bacterium]